MNPDMLDIKAQIVKALAHPLRLAICEYLFESDGCRCVNAIAEHFGKSQSVVSRHLSVLQRVFLVKVERDGVYVKYSVRNRRSMELLLKAITEFAYDGVEAHWSMLT